MTTTDRADLERLDRDTLIARAEEAGVSRANILTRPELVDELLLRTAKKDDPAVTRARGFFGRARDLLARVIERGLHLPEAAELLRRAGAPVSSRRSAPAAVPTVTLAEIYATQGHRGRAIETLKRVLDHEPEHAAARSLLTQLSSTSGPSSIRSPADGATDPDGEGSPSGRTPSPAISTKASEPPLSEVPEPFGFLDDDLLPARYDVDECVAVSVDPTTLFAYWEVRVATLDHVRWSRPDGVVALRVLIVTPSWDGPMSATRDIDVGESLGDWFIRDLPPGAVVRVAIGWRSGEVFLPIAHSPALETPPDKPSRLTAEVWAKWTTEGTIRLGRPDGQGGWVLESGAHGGGAAGSFASWVSTQGAKQGAKNGVHGHAGSGASGEGPQGSSEHAVAG
jgi:hypothetical protein